jgi:putative permease
MANIFSKWYRRYFSEEESVLLLVLLIAGLVVILTLSDILAPLFIAIVLAYLMQGLANQLSAWGVSNRVSVWSSSLIFIGCFFAFTLGVVPLVWRQAVSLTREAPAIFEKLRTALGGMSESYVGIIGERQLDQIINTVQVEIAQLGQKVFAWGLSSIPDLLVMLVYIILVPLLVFFFLKDRDLVLRWMQSFLPNQRPLMTKIAIEMNQQIANYARGKLVEVLIVGGLSYLVFAVFDLNYAALLGLLVGLSVIIPYIGATLVTIPVIAVAFFQWGLTPDFYWVVGLYIVLQVLDGNVLVPLLFSEAVNLHPLAIIVAVIFFGGLWGVWGVFFAIPLATLVNAVVTAWPAALES